jgi:Radical SAM superfamily
MADVNIKKSIKGQLAIVIPPTSDKAVVRDYAGGLGFEPLSTYVLPPLDMLQLAAIAAQEWQVHVHDFSWHDSGEKLALTEVVKNLPTIALVQASLPSISSDLEFARQLKRQGIRSLVRLQHFPVGFLKQVNSQSDDEWIVGECEATLLDILSGESKPGLITNNQDNGERPAFIDDLDSLPFPARELVFNIPYEYPKLGRCVTLQASRGCPHSCGYYCPYPLVQGKRWRKRSIESLVNELKHICHTGITQKIFFRDPVFTLDIKRTEALCTEILKQNIQFQWWCETRADLLPESTVKLMAEAGCIGINIGVETGDESLRLAHLKSNVDNQCIQQTCAYLHHYGIDASLLMMIGWPGENRQSLLKTAELIINCSPRSVGLVFPTAYFGTSFREDMEMQGLLSADEFPTDGFHPQIQSPTMTFVEMTQGRSLVQSVINTVCSSKEEKLNTIQALSNLKSWVNLAEQ